MQCISSALSRRLRLGGKRLAARCQCHIRAGNDRNVDFNRGRVGTPPIESSRSGCSLFAGWEIWVSNLTERKTHGHSLPSARQRLSVLHVINGEHYSGAERVQDLLADRLPECGCDVAFACVKPDRFPAARESQATPLFRIPMAGRADLFAARRLVRLVKQHGFELLHAHTPRSAIVARLASSWAGIPLVYHVHSPTSRDTTKPLRNWLNNQVERFSLRGASRLITVSHSLSKHMQDQGYAADRISVVPNGVPCRQPADRQAPSGTWTVGTVALFRPRKGTEVLLEALASLHHRGIPVRLRAVGPFESTPYENQLKQRAEQLQIRSLVDWTGFRDDVDEQLAKMDLFALPSLFGEGLPMVVLEAMAAGVPVIGTDVEGVPEAILHGRDGLIARPGDPEDLARCLLEVIQGVHGWRTLRQNALARQRERFSDESMARGVAAAYRLTMAGR